MSDLPSEVSKSAMTALTSSLELGSCLDATSAELLAKASLSVPHRPLGSAAETAMPTTVGLSKTLVHSSGVKLCLFAMAASCSSHLTGFTGAELFIRSDVAATHGSW